MKRAALAVLGLVASSLVVTTVPAHAAACDIGVDVTKPVYVSSSISPTSLSLGTKTKNVKVTVKATDNCAIVPSLLSVLVEQKGKPKLGGFIADSFSLTSGTAQNGTFTSNAAVDSWIEGGVYIPTGVSIIDTGGNETVRINGSGSVHVRNTTSLKLIKPASSVKKNKKVTLEGYLATGGAFYKSTVKVQTKALGKGKKWKTVKTVPTSFLGLYETKIKVTSTKYYRLIHLKDSRSLASTSKTYKVKKK